MTFKERRYYCHACHQPHKLLRWNTDPVPECPTCLAPLEADGFAPNAAPGVISDECDVTVEHGICHPDGSPRRYRSKSEMRRVAAQLGYSNIVEHRPLPGTDKSPHTTRWV